MQVSPLNELLAQVREESKEYTLKRVLEGLRERLLAKSSPRSALSGQRSASSTPSPTPTRHGLDPDPAPSRVAVTL
mgnify:CR=1 FL=1